MKFRQTINGTLKLKKRKIQDFELLPDVLKQIKKATVEKPYLAKDGFMMIKAYTQEKKIHLYLYTSFNGFEQIKEKKPKTTKTVVKAIR